MSTPDGMHHADLTPDAQGGVAEDVPGAGWSLVGESMRGGWLGFADPAWVRRLGRWAGWVIVGALLGGGLFITPVRALLVVNPLALSAFIVVGCTIRVTAAWGLTTPTPGLTPGPMRRWEVAYDRSRRRCRGVWLTLLGVVPAMMLLGVWGVMPRAVALAWGWGLPWIWVAEVYVVGRFAMELARGLGDDRGIAKVVYVSRGLMISLGAWAVARGVTVNVGRPMGQGWGRFIAGGHTGPWWLLVPCGVACLATICFALGAVALMFRFQAALGEAAKGAAKRPASPPPQERVMSASDQTQYVEPSADAQARVDEDVPDGGFTPADGNWLKGVCRGLGLMQLALGGFVVVVAAWFVLLWGPTTGKGAFGGGGGAANGVFGMILLGWLILPRLVIRSAFEVGPASRGTARFERLTWWLGLIGVTVVFAIKLWSPILAPSWRTVPWGPLKWGMAAVFVLAVAGAMWATWPEPRIEAGGRGLGARSRGWPRGWSRWWLGALVLTTAAAVGLVPWLPRHRASSPVWLMTAWLVAYLAAPVALVGWVFTFTRWLGSLGDRLSEPAVAKCAKGARGVAWLAAALLAVVPVLALWGDVMLLRGGEPPGPYSPQAMRAVVLTLYSLMFGLPCFLLMAVLMMWAAGRVRAKAWASLRDRESIRR